MQSTTLYIGKNLEKTRQQAAEQEFARKLLEIGPWQIHLDGLMAAKDAGLSELLAAGLSRFLLPRNWANYVNYIFAEDMIFLIARDLRGQDGLVKEKWEAINNEWQRRIKILRKVFPAYAFFLDKLSTIGFRYAEYSIIDSHKKFFPESIPESSSSKLKHGRCAHEDHIYSITRNFTFTGNNYQNVYFSIYSAPLPEGILTASPSEAADHAALLLGADSYRANMRPLPENLLADNTLGHWDLYWPREESGPGANYEKITLATALNAKNPEKDIVDNAVAIDFGTSSTVVALRARGKTRLLRIGGDNLDNALENAQGPAKNPFENPTILKFDNAERLLETWRNEAYRPAISWMDAQCSHQAREELKSNISQSMPGLKIWARKAPDSDPLILTDASGHELRLAPPASPPAASPEPDYQTAPLNPLELYAYYLGLHLNNQLEDGGRIYKEYYMTFPARFEKDVKERILASFRRGLIRSLPPSLIYSCGYNPENITVEEWANEPAAFAAAALPKLCKGVKLRQRDSTLTRLAGLCRLHEERPWEIDPETITHESILKARDLLQSLPKEDKANHVIGCLEKAAANLNEITAFFAQKNIYPDYRHSSLLNKLKDFYVSSQPDEIWGQFEDLLEKEMEENSDDGSEPAINNPAFLEQMTEEKKNDIKLILNMATMLQSVVLIQELADSLQNYPPQENIPHVNAIKPEPTAAGAAFGVFDFGGGTTDYAIGLYRLPTEEEMDEGKEKMVQILKSGCNPDLGGEHLLHELAFEVAIANREKLLARDVAFVRPKNARHVPGAEKLFYQGGIAQGNTRRLMELLRPFWENGELKLEGGHLSETFQNSRKEDAPDIKLDIDPAALRKMLKARIAGAVDEFFTLFGQAFHSGNFTPGVFHVLLAGNSCRSPLVHECFQEKAKTILAAGEEGAEDQIIIHPLLLGDPQNPEDLNIKTGVALGLLEALPWEKTGIVFQESGEAEAPFPYAIGPLWQDRLQPVLKRDAPYNEWFEFGLCPSHGRVMAFYTQSPLGSEGALRREDGLEEIKLNFGPGHKGQKIMVCALTPRSVKFALQKEKGGLDGNAKINLSKESGGMEEEKVVALDRE